MSRKSQSSQSLAQTQDEEAAQLADDYKSNQLSQYDGEKAEAGLQGKEARPYGLGSRAAAIADDKHMIICQLIGGVRIHMKDETPGVIALRVIEVAEKVYNLAVERGFLEGEPKAEPQDATKPE